MSLGFDSDGAPAYLLELHALADRWSSLGTRNFGDRTRLIGRLPQQGIGAYLHRFFGPLQPEDIQGLEDAVALPIPHQLREFYLSHNGCSLFDTISVYGARRSYDRADFDAMSCNPFDLIVPTITYGPRSPSGRGIAINRYEDHSMVLVEPTGEVVRVLSDESGRSVNTWASIGDWLLSEYKRIELLFDPDGVCRVEALDTVPPYRVN